MAPAKRFYLRLCWAYCRIGEEIKWSEDAKISYVPQKILPEKKLAFERGRIF